LSSKGGIRCQNSVIVVTMTFWWRDQLSESYEKAEVLVSECALEQIGFHL
jgi:hypothetical protein